MHLCRRRRHNEMAARWLLTLAVTVALLGIAFAAVEEVWCPSLGSL
jgi:hypothetical protein